MASDYNQTTTVNILRLDLPDPLGSVKYCTCHHALSDVVKARDGHSTRDLFAKLGLDETFYAHLGGPYILDTEPD